MSGGHWDYSGIRLQDILEIIATDEEMKTRWPDLAQLFGELGPILYDIEHDIDWDFSGDSSIKDDRKFSDAAIGKIFEAAMKAAPDSWFPRGKWATIQAVQERKE